MPNSSNDPNSPTPLLPEYRVPHEHGWGMEFPEQELTYDATGIALADQERCPRCGSYKLFPHSVLFGSWASRANVLTCGACGLDYRVIRGMPFSKPTGIDWAKIIAIAVVMLVLVMLCVL